MKIYLATFLVIALAFLSCDKKKSSIAGRVINKTTGEGLYNAIINFNQCKSEGENCAEIIIGQAYTLQSGDFKIDKQIASKSKTKWITVIYNNKQVARVDNVGLNDKNITIEVTL